MRPPCLVNRKKPNPAAVLFALGVLVLTAWFTVLLLQGLAATIAGWLV